MAAANVSDRPEICDFVPGTEPTIRVCTSFSFQPNATLV